VHDNYLHSPSRRQVVSQCFFLFRHRRLLGLPNKCSRNETGEVNMDTVNRSTNAAAQKLNHKFDL
jgi:hypothetical protein